MENSLGVLIVKALDGLSARSVATAQNIANAGTPGYRPLRVSFEAALNMAATQGATAVRSVVPETQAAPIGARDGELRLDLELATARITGQRFDGLVEVLNRQLQLQSLVITGSGGSN